ncbi:MAG: aminopeptidase P family protein [Actinobacteria bacterium]|nr:aminopeptidase P family protein [Actinomycetota bacterium]
MDYGRRADALRSGLGTAGIDALLVTNLTNVRYLTGFSGTNGQVLVWQDGVMFFSDGRYAARASTLVQGADIEIYPNRLSEKLAPLLERASLSKLGVEAATMTLAERDDLANRVDGVSLIPTRNLVEDLRRTKDVDEIALIRQAVQIGDEAFDWILDRLIPGALEREIKLDLEVHMRQTGADEVSFEPIVGSGPLSAHIHHTASDRAFEKGDLILLDFGSRKDGYCSDMTRTLVLGPPTEEQEQIYDLVLRAHLAGIEAVRPGAGGKEVDAAARAVIEAAEQGERFAHGLGHGVGIDIHEAPRLALTSEDELRAGDVVTVEPGVYLPEWGGIRIEDCVFVTEDGHEVLGRSPKDRLTSV